MEGSSQTFYVSPTDYLQQGDIFRQDIVIPIADTEKRIFRAEDGRHGSVVFSDGVNAHVFAEDELRVRLQGCERTPLHTDPFAITHDGHPELVVVHSRLSSYFVIATQTCDVSGVDRKASSTAIILPIITVHEICRHERIPFDSFGEMTILEFLEKNAEATSLREERNAFQFPTLLRKILEEWNPETQVLKTLRGRIRNYLDR